MKIDEKYFERVEHSATDENPYRAIFAMVFYQEESPVPQWSDRFIADSILNGIQMGLSRHYPERWALRKEYWDGIRCCTTSTVREDTEIHSELIDIALAFRCSILILGKAKNWTLIHGSEVSKILNVEDIPQKCIFLKYADAKWSQLRLTESGRKEVSHRPFVS